MRAATQRSIGALFVAAALFVLLALGGCSGRNPREAGGPDTTRVAEASGELEAGAAEPKASLFELPFALVDQAGRERHLSDLRGRPFVASMIYTRCTSVCPRVTADLKNLEKALGDHDRERVRFVLFSLDPEHDDPQALRAFAAEHALDTTRWTLMSTSRDDMRTLAAVLGVRFRPEENGEIAHSATILVVDGEGVVRHRQVGIQDDTGPLMAAVREVK